MKAPSPFDCARKVMTAARHLSLSLAGRFILDRSSWCHYHLFYPPPPPPPPHTHTEKNRSVFHTVVKDIKPSEPAGKTVMTMSHRSPGSLGGIWILPWISPRSITVPLFSLYLFTAEKDAEFGKLPTPKISTRLSLRRWGDGTLWGLMHAVIVQ